MMKQKTWPFKIGIALGGGASLGFAHIGVLEVLEKNGIKPDFVAGTSMGSVIGGLYASGLTTERMVELLQKFDIKKLTTLNFFNLLKSGIFITDKMADYFENLAGIKHVQDTKIPFCCTSVDLHTGKPYNFSSGRFGTALMASTAIPGLFKPVKYGNKLLVDGGVLNNVPFDVCKKMGADFVIGVDVLAHYPQNVSYKSTVKILMNSYGLMQASNEKYRRQFLSQDLNYMLSVPSTKDQLDWSKDAMNFAYQNGKDFALKNLNKIKRKLREFEKQYKKSEN